MLITNNGATTANDVSIIGDACTGLGEPIAPGQSQAIACEFVVDVVGDNVFTASVSSPNFEGAEASVTVVGREPTCPELVSSADQLAFIENGSLTAETLQIALQRVIAQTDTDVCAEFADLSSEAIQLVSSGPGSNGTPPGCNDLSVQLSSALPVISIAFNVDEGCEARSLIIAPADEREPVDSVSLAVVARAITGRSDVADLALSAIESGATGLVTCDTPVGNDQPSWSMLEQAGIWVFESCRQQD